mgnify:CR=1 FL=1
MKPSYFIIDKLILSEKISEATEKNNQYCFKVNSAANKLEIKKAIEELFNVHVIKVNTNNRKGKPRRERALRYGYTSASKRAIVTLKEGDTIQVV